ncbi:MAG: ABC transporter permease, partial [Acidobacteria bacterium]|nr:ABC transporter permease [Acidobacteriota bacterium]
VIGISVHWLWLPVIVLLQLVFVCGMALGFSALDVYFRDMRYVVESANLVLFWIVPIFYSFDRVSQKYARLYELNPIAAVILLTRTVLLSGEPPNVGTLAKLSIVSILTLIAGTMIFQRIERNFSDYL